MPIETASYIADLNPSNPAHTDPVSDADAHARLTKQVLKNQFPNFTSAALASTQAAIDAAVAFSTSKLFALLSGTAAAPSVYLDVEHGTGLYGAAGELDVSIAGTQTVRFSSAGVDVKQGGLLIAGTNIFPVQTANIAAAAVTYAKIQNVSGPNVLLGRKTTAAGPVEEITLGTGLSLVAGALTSATALPRGHIDGLSLSQASTTKLGVSAGATRSDDNAMDLTLSAFAKTTASWVLGTNNGGLDTGAIAASTWYYVYAIGNPTTGASDVTFTVTYGSPTLQSGWTKKRYIGAFRTDGSSHVPVIIQKGNEFFYVAPVTEINTTIADTLAHTLTLTVPPSPGVRAKLSVSSPNQGYMAVTDLNVTDTAVGATFNTVNGGSGGGGGINDVWCNTSGQVRYRMGTTSCTLSINTFGYYDPRGTNA